MNQQEQAESISMHNLGYMNPTALQLRLETENTLAKIEAFLTGKRKISIYNEETREVLTTEQDFGKKLMNNEGVAHILNYIGSIINPQVVQGNYHSDWYREQLENTHKRLAFIITVNTPIWEIKKETRYDIIGSIMEYVKPYLSRLIDNEERKSYAATIKSVESSTMQQNTGGLFSNSGIK